MAPITDLDQSFEQPELLVVLVFVLTSLFLLLIILILSRSGDDVELPNILLGVPHFLVGHPRYLCIIGSQEAVHIL